MRKLITLAASLAAQLNLGGDRAKGHMNAPVKRNSGCGSGQLSIVVDQASDNETGLVL